MNLPPIPPPTPPGTPAPPTSDPLLDAPDAPPDAGTAVQPAADAGAEPTGGPDGAAAPETALGAAVLEIEAHVAADGWDRPARLFALVETARLVEHEPQLAAALALDPDAAAGSLTPVEQDQLSADLPLERQLERIGWPETVAGCAAVVERFVLPPGADEALPEAPAAQADFARAHPERQEVRLVAAATRHGESFCAMRMRAYDDSASVVRGPDLVPGLVALLRETLADDATEPDPAAPEGRARPDDGQGVPGTMEDPDPHLVDPRGRRPDKENHP